jgi:hypothetical protein
VRAGEGRSSADEGIDCVGGVVGMGGRLVSLGLMMVDAGSVGGWVGCFELLRVYWRGSTGVV